MGTLRIVQMAFVSMVAAVCACTKHPSDFCCTTEESCAAFGAQPITPCTNDPDRPYCDDTGAYGLANVCIPDPSQTPCKDAQDCKDPALPFCVGGRCVECDGNDTCDGTEPVCDPVMHSCVECIDNSTCTSTTAPVCDTAERTCRACAADDECASQVCDRDTGSCIPESAVIYLSPSGQTSGTCTRAAPCNTFALGLAQVGGARNVIKAAPGTYNGKATIDAVSVTIFADGATLQPAAADQTAVTITNAADATIVGLTVNGATGPATGVGMRCDAASTLRLRRSVVTGCPGGGIAISGCQFLLLNNIIALNGSQTSAFGGVQIANVTTAGTHEFAFNTVTTNTGAATTTTGVACSTVTIPLSFSSSIIYGNAAASGTPTQASGAMCTWSYSDIGPQPVAGTGNINMDPLFVDPANGNFHVRADTPVRDAADPAATLGVDFDLDARPCGSGRDMGADEVCP